MKRILIALLLASFSLAPAAELTLTWQDNSDNETGFNIERSVDSVRWLPIWQVPADTENFVDTELPGETTYWYRVNAENAAGVSGYSNVAFKTTRTERLPTAPGDANVEDTTGSMVNLSTRGLVTIDSVMIGGLVVSGAPIPVLIRGVGPELTSFGIADPIEDPRLELTHQDGTPILTNDNWSGQGAVDAAIAVGAFDLTAGSLDSVILINLDPGVYTVQLQTTGAPGTGLLEIYHVK